MFDSRRYAELEARARELLKQHPASGFAWKVLGTALFVQEKHGLPALQKAASLLPWDAEVHSNLGHAFKALGDLESAAASYRRALEIKPDFAAACCSLANTLKVLGHLDDAAASYRQALKVNPDLAEAHSNLGNILKAQGRLDDSVESYRRALQIKPDFAVAHSNLGNVLRELGQLDDAAASHRRALAINPDYVEAHCNLGNVLTDLGQLDDAVASFRRALAIKPDFAEAHSNLGSVLKDLGRLDGAVAHCRRALAIKPDFAEAHNNLGNVLKEMGHLEAAEASYRHALAIKPEYAEAYSNLGNVLKDIGRLDDAAACCRRALELDPDFADAHCNLGNVLRDAGRLDDAVASYRRALACNPDFDSAYGNLLFTHNYMPDQSADMLLSEARGYGALVARQARPYASWKNVPLAGRRLRVGLVSGDMGNHPVGYFLEAVLAALASDMADRLELCAYPTYARTDSLAGRIRGNCHEWTPVAGLSDERLAERIHNDRIDVLIDLSGHTARNRLPMFAWKPAPVQVSWLGYFATTGVAEIDYLIADPWTLPETEEIHFTEKIWRLPETRLCFTPPEVDVGVSPLPVLTAGHICFGCFNNLTKMNDAVVTLWAGVLRAVAGSRLFLKARQLDVESVRRSTFDRFAAHGIGEDRLVLEGMSARALYLGAYSRVDITLDPFPFSGGTTTAESLWMGVPVLTLAGQRFVSRQGLGLMANAGLHDWIAVDADDYVARAVAHASDSQGLAALREGLRQQVRNSPVFDAARFAGHFETALRGMWANWCTQQPGYSPVGDASGQDHAKGIA